MRSALLFVIVALIVPAAAIAVDPPLKPMDIFDLEVAIDPQISPDGKRVVYVRRSFDVRKDRSRVRLWIVNADGSDHKPLTDGSGNESSPVWSPDGKRIAYLSNAGGRTQLAVRWLNTGESAKLANLPAGPLTDSKMWCPS